MTPDELRQAGVRVKRLVTVKECPWLEQDIEAGTLVYPYYGPTYGCIGPNGIAVTIERGKTPFFELPRTALAALEAS